MQSTPKILEICRTHTSEEAAILLDVDVTTIWRFKKEHMPEMVASRRPKINYEDIPIDTCLEIYNDVVLKKLGQRQAQEKYDFSRKAIQYCTNRGRDESQRRAASRVSLHGRVRNS